MWFSKRSDTKQAVQAKMARGWKFWIEKAEELYYPCSENKGADQLCSYCEANLRPCFRICKMLAAQILLQFLRLHLFFNKLFVMYTEQIRKHNTSSALNFYDFHFIAKGFITQTFHSLAIT